MTLQIGTPHQAARLTIIVMRTRKPTLLTTQCQVVMTKSATALSSARKTIEKTVAEMDLLSINKKMDIKLNIEEHTLSYNNLDK